MCPGTAGVVDVESTHRLKRHTPRMMLSESRECCAASERRELLAQETGRSCYRYLLPLSARRGRQAHALFAPPTLGMLNVLLSSMHLT